MLEEDLDDTHLCIKCSSTIVGIDNYIQHRKSGCGGKTSRSAIVGGYAGFGYPDASSVYQKSAEVEDSRGKGSKALNDPYDLPYELGADVFFSSLQLQSVQASGGGGGGGGKTSSRQQIITVKETSTLLSSASARDETETEWHEEPANNSDNLMKVVRDIGESKKFEPIFQPISFTHNESPEPEQSDDDEEEDEVFEDDDEEDYVPTPYSGGKWKPGSQPPPRSGGKWKSRTQSVVELPPPPQVGGKCPFKAAVSGGGKLRSYARPAPAEKTVPETSGKWKLDSSKWKPCGPQESHDVFVPQTGGKWKPGSSKPDVPETGGKWKPGFAKPATDGQESPDIMEEPAADDRASKSIKSPEVPETGGKWKPGYEKPQACQRRRHSDGHDPPEVIMAHKWMPVCSKKLKLHPPHTSGGKWKPGDDHESPVSMDHRSWSPENSKSLTTPPSDKWKSPEEQESPELLEPHTGGKWKPGQRPGSEVPTGGKWKPGHRPEDAESSGRKWKQSSWDEHEAWEDADHTHPPVEHTKGKWVPGTKIDRLQFKEVEVPAAVQDFWCNICCRKLKTKSIYDKHLQSNAHLRKSETEEQLDRVAVEQLELSQRILHPPALLLERAVSPEAQPGKRKRRKIFIKCDICKYRMQKLLVGKHLISHYHFVRMAANPQRSFGMILEYMHQIVLQSPYQCVPCRFFANTEENFLLHWNSVDHRDKTEGPGKFWCSFCRFECEDNNQMRRHLLSTDHREVILAINRSVPICITKKVNIECPKCLQSFRYNMELRQHAARCDGTSVVPIGTASDEYQSRFRCELCPDEGLKSQTALQRHHKYKHNHRRFYCHVCDIEFQSAPEAVKHRKTSAHKNASAGRQAVAKKGAAIKAPWDQVSPSEMEAVLQHIIQSDEDPPSQPEPRKCAYCKATFKSKSELKSHITAVHPEAMHACPLCGESFVLPHELGFHRRYKMCVASATKQLALPSTSQMKDADATKSWLCPDCPFGSDLESELIFHQIMHTKGVDALQTTGKLKCPLCEKSLPRHSLRYHIRLHTNEKMFKCEHCEATFARRHNYKDHMRTMHAAGCDATSKLPRPTRSTAESFVCDTCGKIFRTKYALKYHSNIHMERDRKFLCPVEHCQYIGRNKAALQMHSSTHILQTEFKCEQNGCRYKGKTAYHLKRHMKNHSEPGTVLKCPECDFVAKRKAHIIRHRRIHTGEMPYECPHCDYKCAYVENLRKHILTTKKHPGKFIYECDKCDPKSVYKTNYNNEFQMHLIVAHPTQ